MPKSHSGIEEISYMGIDGLLAEYYYEEGEPETGPSYACGGTPAISSGVDVERVWLAHEGSDIDLTDLFSAAYTQIKLHDGTFLYKPMLEDLAETIREHLELSDND